MSPAEAVALVVDGRPLPPMAMVTVDGGGGYWNPHPGDDPMEMVISELIPMCQGMNLGGAADDRHHGHLHGWIRRDPAGGEYPELIRAVAAISPAIWTSTKQAQTANPGAYASAADFADDDAVTHTDALGEHARPCRFRQRRSVPSRRRRPRGRSPRVGGRVLRRAATPAPSSRPRSRRLCSSWVSTSSDAGASSPQALPQPPAGAKEIGRLFVFDAVSELALFTAMKHEWVSRRSHSRSVPS